ncbi:MAG: PhzF family phenazine biosynthesis protein [Aestuariivirga sp.]
MKLKFHTLDVFTNRKFAGNPLAVVLGADHLSTQQMQTITKEFNLSETTFVMQPDDPANTAKVRIFYPGGEMPFAGHPTIGTAILLAEMRGLQDVRLELKAGLTPVKIMRADGAISATLTAPVVPFHVDVQLPRVEDTALALNLDPADIGFDGHQLASLEGGPRFFYVPVKSRAALEKSQVREPYWSELLKPMGNSVDAAYLYTRGGDGPNASFRARMYSPTGGIPEDPATGSATALLAAQLLTSEKLKDGTHHWQLEQGYEMGRPSDLHLEADVKNGKLTAVRVGGAAIQLMSGEIDL